MSNKKKSAADTAISTAEENKIISIPIIDQACKKIKTSAKAKLCNKAEAIESATAAALKLFCPRLLKTVATQYQTKIQHKMTQLQSSAETLKNQRDGYSKQIDILKEKLSDTDETIDTLKEKLSDTSENLENAQRYIKELENRPIEIAVQESNNDRLLREKIEYLESEKAKQKENLESDKQSALNKLTVEYEKKLAEVLKNNSVDDDKVKFKVYLTAAYDALQRLICFTSEHKDNSIFKQKIRQLLTSILSELEE